MRWLRIAPQDVQALLESPERTAPSIKGRTNAWGFIGDRWIQVCFVDEDHRRVVITVFAKER